MARFIQDADINVYYMLVTPRFMPRYDYNYGVSPNVHIATHGTNLAPEVGDVITGDYGYKSQRGEVVAVRELGQNIERGTANNFYAFEADLAEIEEES